MSEPTPEPPPVTLVTVRPQRNIGLASFNDLTGDVAALSIESTTGRRVVITFPGTLTAEQTQAVHDRAASMDDEDQADRAVVAALMADVEADATDPPDPLVSLVLALACRSLSRGPTPTP